MTRLDLIGGIVSLIIGVVCYIGYLHASDHVRLTYKDQRVGVRTKWWRR